MHTITACTSTLQAAEGDRERALTVRQHRKLAFLSQARLAERAGVSLLTVMSVENGKRPPRLRTIENICKALSVAPTEVREFRAAFGLDEQQGWIIQLSRRSHDERDTGRTRSGIEAHLEPTDRSRPDEDERKIEAVERATREMALPPGMTMRDFARVSLLYLRALEEG